MEAALVARDIVLAAALVAALISDLRSRRIYDWITLPALGLGLLFALLAGGVGESWFEGLKGAAAGALLCYAFFALMVLFGGMGGGDAKLMAAVGALLGFPAAGGALLFVAIAGGLQGVLTLVLRAGPVRRQLVRLGARGADAPGFGKTVPYGVAIAFGTLAFRLWILAEPVTAGAQVGP